MRLLSNSKTLIRGGCTPFQAVEGVEPYVYSIVSGEGQIDPVTGLFQASNSTGPVVIRATAADAEEVDLEIVVLGPLSLFCSVIKEELNLDSSQVYIYNQKYSIPPDSKMYIAVGVGIVKPIGSVNREGDQYSSFKAALEVNILSKSEEALERKEEVLMALNSDFSKRLQAQNGFYIAPLSSQFNNLSETEGLSQVFRFNITVNIQYAITKLGNFDYYNQFNDNNILINK